MKLLIMQLGKVNLRTKILINNKTIEQANNFNYLGHTITETNNRDLGITMSRFNPLKPRGYYMHHPL
jgi:hypothetical protein